MASKVILIYGATGAIGTNLIHIITKEQPGWTILAATRSGGSNSHLASLNLPNVKLVKSDIENLEDARQITKDVDMVFSCIGFPQYEAKYWAVHWPIVVENLLQVTSSTRPLIFCDNLYAYGSTTNISPTSKTVAPSPKSKPGIRAMMRETFQKRLQSDPRSLVVVGGSDFFGPRLEGKSMLVVSVLSAIAAKRTASVFGSATVKHDFCYTPDFSNALYTVSVNRDKAMGKFWICPHSLKDLTVAEIATKAYQMMGMKDKGVTVLPVFMIKFLGLFMTLMREMDEMMPSWTKDYTVDDSDFCSTFGVRATPVDQALRETLDYYKSAEK